MEAAIKSVPILLEATHAVVFLVLYLIKINTPAEVRPLVVCLKLLSPDVFVYIKILLDQGIICRAIDALCFETKWILLDKIREMLVFGIF